MSGTAEADSIYGLDGNDTLRGLVGDSLIGGGGDDTYFVTGALTNLGGLPVSVTELANGGYDALYLNITEYLGGRLFRAEGSVEELHIAGQGHVIVWGDSGDNYVDVSGLQTLPEVGQFVGGKAGDDVLIAGSSNDRLDGGEGIDGMAGGKGDDEYYVDNVGDVIVENSGGGWDTVYSSANCYRLASNVEQLHLEGDERQFQAYGNAGDNYIYTEKNYSRSINAGRGNDHVEAWGNAADILNGGAGNDTLMAGLGDDIYRVSGDFGYDEITDIGGDDAVEFDVAKERLWLTRSGNDLNVSVIGAQNGVTVKNWYSDPAARIEEFYAGDGKILAAGKVEQLVSAMSAFSPPTTATLPSNIQSALAPTLASVWQ